MIEIIDPTRCTSCNICVKVCPTNVFGSVKNSIPVIARQSDCQTCFMCELYCPADALYVAPFTDELQIDDIHASHNNIDFGSYRRAIGWTKETNALRASDQSFELLKP
ncbi:4Fe-4S dicluster domain-containing protein [Beijerinckia indica]|uniref:4Fe-4S ferredoxin iron-sulfur binding domain protein n=1 Tax=Beijerinckia indica subsp. indica (strain ATCC 9039 / DSM 1715 / NCIMB 8712) TaxID=395963 RepID=B2IF08_BEII9|nr:ferredoxin family protein [Beijerinckia indica]ACB94199.1 4Fe-4S ferredoxin iron-sulfur binding domain protein [Beijerinckia indica subsp. indica ATCC 9039]